MEQRQGLPTANILVRHPDLGALIIIVCIFFKLHSHKQQNLESVQFPHRWEFEAIVDYFSIFAAMMKGHLGSFSLQDQ